jgi:hypothetical protein
MSLSELGELAGWVREGGGGSSYVELEEHSEVNHGDVGTDVFGGHAQRGWKS